MTDTWQVSGMADDEEGDSFQRALGRFMEADDGSGGFAPRKSLARTPPQGFSASVGGAEAEAEVEAEAAGVRGLRTQPVSPPYGTPSGGPSKRPLSSPLEAESAALRRRTGRTDGAPPVAGILTGAPPQAGGGAVSQPVTAKPAALAEATVEGLTGLATSATQGIMDAVRAKTSRLNKDEVAAIGAHTERLSAVIAHMAVRLAAAEAKLSVQPPAVVPTAQPKGNTYANMLKLPQHREPIEMGERVEGPVLAVYPAADKTGEIKSADETKAELKKAIDPAKLFVQVSRVRKVGNAGVVVQTTNEAAASRLREAMPPSLRVAEPRRRQPLVCFNRLDGNPSFDEVLVALHDQNYREDSAWPLSRIQSEAKGAFKKNRARGAATAVIFACSAALRESLLQKSRVFIGWQAVEVTDYIMVTCCNKCQQYGHPEKFCRSKEEVCGRCGNVGHKTEACKSASTCCATCKRFGKKGGESHRTASKDCPARMFAEKRSVEMTHYG